jgi:hypothetical protein
MMYIPSLKYINQLWGDVHNICASKQEIAASGAAF